MLKDGEKSYYRKDTEGLAQGTSTAPICFCIGLDKALRRLTESSVKVLAYADDILLISTASKYLADIRGIKHELAKIKLELNIQKSEILTYGMLKKGKLELLGEHF